MAAASTTDILPWIPFRDGSKLTETQRNALTIVMGGLAPGTQRLYQWCWRSYRDVGGTADVPSLIKWINAARVAKKGTASIRLMVNAIKQYLKTIGHEIKGTDKVLVRAAHKRARRENRGMGKRGQAPGATWAIADRAAELAASEGTEKGLRDAAIIALGSDGLLRVSEISDLRVSDISGTSVLIAHSKTDQYGNGETVKIGPPTVKAIQNYLSIAGHDDGYLFRSLGRPSGTGALTTRTIGNIIKTRLDKDPRTGEGPGLLLGARGHSLRRGSAAELYRRGASLLEIKKVGRWKSVDTVARYIEDQLPNAMERIRYGRD